MLKEVGGIEGGSEGGGYCSWALHLAFSLERMFASKGTSRSDDAIINSKQGVRCIVTA